MNVLWMFSLWAFGCRGVGGWEDIWKVVHYDEHLVLDPLRVVRYLDDAEGDGLILLVRMQAGASDDCEGAFRGTMLEEHRSQTLDGRFSLGNYGEHVFS